jgi:hypothetical protein
MAEGQRDRERSKRLAIFKDRECADLDFDHAFKNGRVPQRAERTPEK